MAQSSISQRLAACLLRDAELHDTAPDELGGEFDELDATAPRDDPDMAVAIAFWDAWIDERNHGFPGHYEGISIEDWPVLARHIATSLTTGQTISEPRIQQNFVFQPRSTLLGKLRSLLRG
jgi:hypothetical protein